MFDPAGVVITAAPATRPPRQIAGTGSS